MGGGGKSYWPRELGSRDAAAGAEKKGVGPRAEGWGEPSSPFGHARQEVVREAEYSRWGPPWTLRLKERIRFITLG